MENDTRMMALMALVDILENDKYSHIVINDVLKKYQYMSKTERAFFTRLCEGTVETKIQLDYIIDCFSSVKTRKMKPIIRNILRMAVYQLKYMNSVPQSAACNEAVRLASKKGFKNLKGFVNGVLRNIARNIDKIEYPKEDVDYTKYLSIKYSMPEWIITKWIDDYGKEKTKDMLQAFMSQKNTTICCNTNKITKEELIKKLDKDNIKYTDCSYVENALRIDNYDYITKISSFKEGEFFVQDESSMIAVEAAAIKPDSEKYLVLDVCSAPGGKTMNAACKLNGVGRIVSRDISDNKTSLIESNIKRCCFTNVKVEVFDALKIDETMKEKADVVIADLPCSGLGVMGQKSDIKYKTSKESLDELATLQRQILDVVKQYVKPGGTLLYSTCTVNKDENEENVMWFDKSNDDFELESLDNYISEKLHNESSKKGYLQIFPKEGSLDGFFMARFIKKK